MSFPGRHLQRCWHLVDAQGQTVGRLAAHVATLLKGKHKPTFQPNKDMGDNVVVINANKVHFTGKKWKKKFYRWHTGFPGGLKERSAENMLERNPTQILRKAIIGMLRKNKLRHGFIEPRLHVYAATTHPHTAQLPLDVTPLPPVPRSLNGTFHYGFINGCDYAHPKSFQEGIKAAPSQPAIEMMDL